MLMVEVGKMETRRSAHRLINDVQQSGRGPSSPRSSGPRGNPCSRIPALPRCPDLTSTASNFLRPSSRPTFLGTSQPFHHPHQQSKMPPRKVIAERGYGSGKRIQKSYFASTYETLSSSENLPMVKAIAAFGVRRQVPHPPP